MVFLAILVESLTAHLARLQSEQRCSYNRPSWPGSFLYTSYFLFPSSLAVTRPQHSAAKLLCTISLQLAVGFGQLSLMSGLLAAMLVLGGGICEIPNKPTDCH